MDRRRASYVSRTGEWAEDPTSLDDRLVHHVLFSLPAFAGSKGMPPAAVLAPCFERETAEVIARLGGAEKGEPPGPVRLIRGLALLLQNAVLRRNGRRAVPDWRREEIRRRGEDLSRLAGEEARIDSLLGAGARARLEARVRVEGPWTEFFDAVVTLVAEEDGILADLRDMRRDLSIPERAEEAAGRILDRIHPPLGIVSHTPPAMLLPCLGLLADERLGLETGIPHAASVILSILRDPRSTAGLLRALGRFPPSCSKIRENVIYTLGCLGEGRAVPSLTAVVAGPDEAVDADGRVRLLVDQKVEAVWALGKIGAEAVEAIPDLARCADHESAAVQTAGAWALGEIGRAQKERLGGLDADVVIALLKLLKVRNRQVDEETVAALRKVGLPEFVHSLYLYHAGAVNLQGLQPAQRGLYELSETLHHLIRSKGRAVMAVTGDSGTGKTFFCRAIAGGFGSLGPEDILYLMRDSKNGQKIFNRLLGLRWLKKNIDPAYYHDYPLSEEEDDPGAFLEEFLEANKRKKLIILDGCRDRDYFQRVIDAFYERGALDLDVTFRATFSTRRLNLEERELAMESVKTHLAFLEEPALEDTPFYREGLVLVYDFDNSVGSRLDRDETLELFDRQKIESWGEFIGLGSFDRNKRKSPAPSSGLDLRVEAVPFREARLPPGTTRAFRRQERHVRPVLNDDLAADPNLLETFDLGDLSADRLRLYARNQAAGTAEDGRVFVLSFIDNRLLIAGGTEGGAVGLTLLGRDLAVLPAGGSPVLVSFERNEVAASGDAGTGSPALAVGSAGRETLVTGHEDGSILVRSLGEGRARVFDPGRTAVAALACDRRGRICAGAADGRFFRLDPESGKAEVVRFEGRRVSLVKPFLRDTVLVVTEPWPAPAGPVHIHVLDLEAGTSRTVGLEAGRRVTSVAADGDGRIIAGLEPTAGGEAVAGATLLVAEISGKDAFLSVLAGHAGGTRDCLVMGPRIVSCGLGEAGEHALRVWGTASYVRTEAGKLAVRAAWPSSSG
jgi:hypothetical protein